MTPDIAALSPAKSTRPRAAHLVVAAMGLALVAAMQWNAYLNHDVAWFTWGADRMLHGAVLGRDLIEPNFPLAYLIYVPAALLGQAFGLSAGLKLWMLALSAFCLAMALPRLDRSAQLPFLLMFALFVAFAMPREAGQREQIALLLVLPYCLPAPERGWRAIVVGAMAGVGFAIKPHFLLAWLVVELGRKPFRTEQLALIATGVAYAASILIFFRPFAFDMLPLTRQVYDAFDRPGASDSVLFAALLAGVLLLAGRVVADRTVQFLALAAAGFVLAAVAQQRFYPYQMLPAWGLLSIGVAVLLTHRRPIATVAALLVVAGLGLKTIPASAAWWRDDEHRRTTVPELTALLDGYQSFAVLAVHPYPAFPTAIYTQANYVGLSNSHWFLPAVAQSDGRSRVAAENAVRQAVIELSREPQVVIVDTDWRRHTASPRQWNGLDFLTLQPEFASLWRRYHCYIAIDSYEIHIRRTEMNGKPALDGSRPCRT